MGLRSRRRRPGRSGSGRRADQLDLQGNRPMSRLFEMRSREGTEDVLAIIDLDKVCLVQIERQAGHHYERLLIQFVGGQESREVVPATDAGRFLEAYRNHL